MDTLCPKCNAPMITVQNRKTGSVFLTCTRYYTSGCKGSLPYRPAKKETVAPQPIELPWLPEQITFFDAVLSGQSVMVQATAGAGKSTVAAAATWQLLAENPNTKIAMLAFTNRDANDLTTKVPANVTTSTVHKFCKDALKKVVRRAVFAENQTKKKIIELVKLDGAIKELGDYIDDILFIINGIKANVWGVENTQSIKALLKTHNVQTNFDLCYHYVQKYWDTLDANVTRAKKGEKVGFDLGDIIYLTVLLDVKMPHYDVVFVDEAQDQSFAQMKALGQIEAEQYVIIGDQQQAIYGWRHAMPDALNVLAKKFNAAKLELGTSQRCSNAVVDTVKRMLPNALLTARVNAPTGQAGMVSEAFFIKNVLPGDMVLCRTNADILPFLARLLKQGQKAHLANGRFRQKMFELVYYAKSADFDKIRQYLATQVNERVVMLNSVGAYGEAHELKLMCDVLLDIMLRVKTYDQLLNKLVELLSPQPDSICISTIHSAKGGQARRVWLLRPDLVPHPKAETAFEYGQELNALFVALTRAKDELYIVKPAE